jgi:hypothetical protein
MEWLKKHWDILAAGAAGILLLYWLYVEYQNQQASSAQAAQSTELQNQEQADEAAYAQQVALSQLGSDSSGGATGDSSVSTQGNVTTSTNPTTSTATTPIVTGDPVASSGVDPTLLAPPPNQTPDYSFSQNSSVANNPNPIYPAGSPQSIALGYSGAINTLLGSGAQPTPVTQPIAITPDVTDGTIPEHGTAIPKTPTPVELASLGARGSVR